MLSRAVINGITACLLVLILFGSFVSAFDINQTTPVNGTLKNYSVVISNFAFEPQQLNITVNSSVIWTNEDEAPHNIATDKDAVAEIKSDLFKKGETFEFNFTKAGSYPYHCGIHPSMTGIIVVTP